MKAITLFARLKARIGTSATFALALALALLMGPMAAEAQHDGKMYRIAFVHFPERLAVATSAGLETFREALRVHGWIEGKNYVLETRLGASEEKLPEVSAQVVREKFDLVVVTNTLAAMAVREATTTIPIVMAGTCDPVECGVVGSLAHPTGNVTGITIITSEVEARESSSSRKRSPDSSASRHSRMGTTPSVSGWSG